MPANAVTPPKVTKGTISSEPSTHHADTSMAAMAAAMVTALTVNRAPSTYPARWRRHTKTAVVSDRGTMSPRSSAWTVSVGVPRRLAATGSPAMPAMIRGTHMPTSISDIATAKIASARRGKPGRTWRARSPTSMALTNQAMPRMESGKISTNSGYSGPIAQNIAYIRYW